MNGLESLFDDLEVGNPCTIICEAYEEYKGGAGVQYDRALSNAQILSNQIIRDYDLNCKQAKVRCLKESGTMDDYAFYEAAASQGAIGKLRAIIESIIKFFKDLCEKAKVVVSTKICSVKAKNAVKKMEKQIKLNPQLASEKVYVPDHSQMLGLISRQRTRLDAYDARLITSFTGPMKPKTLVDTIEDFNTAVGNIIAGGALTYAITLGALVVDLMSEMDRLPPYLTKLEVSQNKILKRLLELIDDDVTAAAAMAAVQQSANFRVQLNKQELDTRLQSVYDKVKALQDAIARFKGKYPVNVNVVEDGDESDNQYTNMPVFEEELIEEEWFDQPFFEGTNSDIRKTYKEFRGDFSSAMKVAKAAYKKGDYVTARKELYKANGAIDKGIAAINAIDKSDTSSAVIGTLIGSCIMSIKATLAAIPTFGLGAYVVLLNESMKQSKEIMDAQNKHNLDVGDNNLYRNQQKAALRNLRKVINAMLQKIQKAEQSGAKNKTEPSSNSKAKSSVKNESWDDPVSNDTFFEDGDETEINEYLEGLLDSVI